MKRLVVGFVALSVALLAAPSFAAGSRSDPEFKATHKGKAQKAVAPQTRTPRVGGDTCASPPTQVGPTPYTDPGNTCGFANDFGNVGPSTCRTNLPFPYNGEDVIYRVDLGAGNSVQFSADITGSAGDLALFLLGTCGVDTSCIANSSDLIGPGVGPEVIPTATYAVGDYYLYVDSYYDAGTAGSCGTYTLTVSGTLPAELIDFQVR